MFPPNLPWPGQLLLVTDELSSPAEFILHRALSSHLKDSKNNKCILISVSESLDRWKAVAMKSVCNSSMYSACWLTTGLFFFEEFEPICVGTICLSRCAKDGSATIYGNRCPNSAPNI
jgi:hypothetical protein